MSHRKGVKRSVDTCEIVASSAWTTASLNKLTVPQLKDQLAALGVLNPAGKKADLVSLLLQQNKTTEDGTCVNSTPSKRTKHEVAEPSTVPASGAASMGNMTIVPDEKVNKLETQLQELLQRFTQQQETIQVLQERISSLEAWKSQIDLASKAQSAIMTTDVPMSDAVCSKPACMLQRGDGSPMEAENRSSACQIPACSADVIPVSKHVPVASPAAVGTTAAAFVAAPSTPLKRKSSVGVGVTGAVNSTAVPGTSQATTTLFTSPLAESRRKSAVKWSINMFAAESS